jgi:hypothetical protein
LLFIPKKYIHQNKKQSSMKTEISLILAAASLIGMTACSNNDEPAVQNNDPVAVQFTAASPASTRLEASGDKWENGDAIGVFMVQTTAGIPATVESAVNFKYLANINAGATNASAETTFKPSDNVNTIYYPLDNSKVGFIAYYPWKSGQTFGTYAVNVSGTQSDQSALDLLYAKTAETFQKDPSAPVALTFTHQLVKLIITAEAGAGIDIGDLSAVTIYGLNTEADFNLTTGVLGATSTAAAIIPQTITAPQSAVSGATPVPAVNGVYEAILLPAAVTTGAYVMFTVDGEDYKWDLAGDVTALTKATKYQYTITVTKTGAELDNDGSKSSITPWTTPGAGTGKAY